MADKVTEVETPKVSTEEQGEKALNHVLTILDEGATKLRRATDHYLYTYQGEFHPGVATCLDNGVKNFAAVYGRTNDEIIKQVVKSAETFTQKVEEPLKVIENGGENTKPWEYIKDLDGESRYLLRKLFEAGELPVFNHIAGELTEKVNRGVKSIRDGAEKGQEAAKKVSALGEIEQEDFHAWWHSNYQEGYGTSVPSYEQDLQRLVEASKGRFVEYEMKTNTIIKYEVRSDTADPLHDFIADYSKSKFPQPQKG